MIRLSCSWLASVFLLAGAAPAMAQAPPVQLSVRPFPGHPYRLVVAVEAREAVEVVADRRLLRLELRSGRRRFRCTHAAAPRRVQADRVRALESGERYEAWVDVRMLCWGRALALLSGGEPLEVRGRYGFSSRGRERWVVRRREGGGRPLHRIDGPSLRVSLPSAPSAEEPEGEPFGEELTISLRPTTARRGRDLRLVVSAAPRSGSFRVYAPTGAWRFVVTGPSGERTRCAMGSPARQPPRELFRRVSARYPLRAILELSYFCPDGTFEAPGVYLIEPRLRLRADGAGQRVEALTGRFRGPPQPVRITRGDQRGYVVQELRPAGPTAAGDP